MYNPFKEKKCPGELHTSPIIRRYPNNPILTADDVPYEADYVFNAGVARYNGKYYIAPRVDVRNKNPQPGEPSMEFIGTGLGYSDDGIHFTMFPEIVRVHYFDEILPWVCDARLTVVEGELYLSFCFENQHAERPGIAKYRGSGVDFDVVTLGVPDQRNMILCPEKINGLYMRLERPCVLHNEPFHIWASRSPDLKFWGESELMLGVEDVPYASVKIGGGAPLLRTEKGWLMIFHAVDDNPIHTSKMGNGSDWSWRYTAGAALFDLADPGKLIAMTREPLLVAEEPYETGNGKVWIDFVVFPCGAVLEDDHETLRIYYGAGDYSTNLAFTTLTELWSVMTPCERLAKRATIPFRIQDWKKEK